VLEKKNNNNNKTEQSSPCELRRRLVFTGAISSVLPWAINSAGAASTPVAARQTIVYPDRELSLYNIHTGEKEKIVYWADGKYLQSGLNQVNWLMRDFRTNEVKTIDPRLINIVYLVTRQLDSTKPVMLLSGYRSKKTNDMLRKTTEGVARRSYHMAGRAIDIRIPRVQTRSIQRAALRLAGGGVGYYPNSDFVHLDSGPVRTW